MKYRNAIKSVFEQEEKKETLHIKALEKQILSKIREEENLDSEMKTYFPQRKSFWTNSLPYAFAVILIAVLFFSVTTQSQVMAKGSIWDALVGLKNQLQQELTNLLSNDPAYRDKNTQQYKQAQNEWCAVSARPPYEQEKAVAAIRDFLDKSNADIEYECAIRNPNKPNEKPKQEIYIFDFERFIIDTKTNTVVEMITDDGTWGEAKDGSHWISSQKQYDYTPRYTQEQAEEVAREFITSHEKALGKIDLSKLILESNIKEDEQGRVTYFFVWKGQLKNDVVPQLNLTLTQGGQIVHYSNQLAN